MGFTTNASQGYAEHFVLFPETYLGNVSKICVPRNTVVTTFTGEVGSLKYKGMYGSEDEAIEVGVGALGGVKALAYRYSATGVRYWKANDVAETGDLFLYHNPFTF